MNVTLPVVSTPPVDLEKNVAKDRERSERNCCISAIAACILCVAAPYIIGAPMWVVGNQNQNDNLVIAGKVFVIGGGVLEGMIAFLALFYGCSLSSHNGEPGAAH